MYIVLSRLFTKDCGLLNIFTYIVRQYLEYVQKKIRIFFMNVKNICSKYLTFET